MSNNMPVQPDAVMWLSLFGACKPIKNLNIGPRAFPDCLKRKPKNHASYVLVLNLYTDAGKEDDAASSRTEMQETGLRKVPGRSWMLINNEVHAFLDGDRLHSETELILLELKRVIAMVGHSRGRGRGECNFGYLPPFGSSFRLARSGHVRKTSEPVEPWDKRAERRSLHFLQTLVHECTQKKDVAGGRQAQALIQQHGLESNTLVGGQLVHMFACFGNLTEAKQAFDKLSSPDAFAWAAIMSAHGRNGQSMEAIGLYQRVQQSGTKPNGHVFVAALKACTDAASLKRGKLVHAHIVESDYESDVFVGSTLIDMYAKCGSLQEAWNVFSRLPSKNIVAWTVMISACAQHGHGEEGLGLLKEMQAQGLEPDRVTFCSALKACSSIAALERGRTIHSEIMERGMETDIVVGSTLMDMYSSCGSIEDAHAVFDKLWNKDVIAWTTMIAGCAEHGRCWEALQLYEQMQQGGVKPNNVTFVCLLSACSHAGLVEHGMCLFRSMCDDYRITPELEHYACIVDLLGRAGHLSEAEDFLHQLPATPDIALWMSLLGACQIHSNVGLGKQAFEAILELDSTNVAAYVLMSNIYAACGMWEEEMDTRTRLRKAGVEKKPGRSWLEVNCQVHSFVKDEKTHPERRVIYDTLQTLTELIKSGEQVYQ